MRNDTQISLPGVVFYAFITLALPVPLVAALHGTVVDTRERLLTFDLGIVAYCWWVETIVLAARLKLIERLLPLPLLYHAHSLLAIIALLAAGLHKYFGYSYHQEVRTTGDIAWWVAVASFLWGVLMLSGVLVDRVPVVAALKRCIEKFVRHRLSVWIHRLQWMMVVAVVLHVQFIPRLGANPVFNSIFLTYFAATVIIYVYGLLRRTWMPRLRGRISAITRLDERTVLLTVKTPLVNVPAGATYMLRTRSEHLTIVVQPDLRGDE